MTKRLFSAALVLTLLLGALVLPVCAWVPDDSFWCRVDPAGIPEGTVYVELLLPILEDDEAYTSFHQQNGEFYGIGADSEIVSYCEDGYRSYTFHVADAWSEMRPFYIYNFVVEPGNFGLFSGYGGIPLGEGMEERRQYSLQMYWNNAEEASLRELLKQADISVEGARSDLRVNHNDWQDADGNTRNPVYDLEYCGKTYKWAKYAYLDGAGNVLLVSNAVSIRKAGSAQLNLSLSGEVLTSEAEYGPPYYLLIVVPLVLLILLILGIVLLVRHCIRKKRIRACRQKSNHG